MKAHNAYLPSREHSILRAGVSLLELMIVLAIIAILVAVAYPVIAENQLESRVDNAAREVGRTIKRQHLRAQNFNRSMFFYVDTTNQKVQVAALDPVVAKAAGRTNRSCNTADMDTASDALVIDGLFTGAKLTDPGAADPWIDHWVCIRPNGQIIDPASSTPFSSGLKASSDLGGMLRFYVERDDGVGDYRVINLPFNGVVRHSTLPR